MGINVELGENVVQTKRASNAAVSNILQAQDIFLFPPAQVRSNSKWSFRFTLFMFSSVVNFTLIFFPKQHFALGWSSGVNFYLYAAISNIFMLFTIAPLLCPADPLEMQPI